MRPPFPPSRLPIPLLVTGLATLGVLLWCTTPGDSRQPESPRPAGTPPKPAGCWQVDDVKPGMKGHGLTVMKGTQVEKFSAEVIGVLKNTSPGRDMVLCRLAGLDLERSGIIAGMSANALKQLRGATHGLGLVPLQGGAASATIAAATKNVNLEAGGPLAVSLIRGDFDLSGIGTVTHIEGRRVYGWGHPFMGMGDCDFPLMTGFIHTIYPRQTVSFKIGSPLRPVGVINADVSTCIAGWLGKQPDLMPMKMSIVRSEDSAPRTFNVELARHKALLSSLVYTALVNSVDMEGEMPEEMTADMQARIEVEGHAPLLIKDTFSGFSGGR